VILLEDDPDVLDATTLVLEDEGFHVQSARELEHALELARTFPRCVILLDLSLDGDVPGFVRSVHAVPGWAGQVLLFSAGDRLEERAHAMGADGAIPKPFDIDTLVHELRIRSAGSESAASLSPAG
jgi:two-component system OmpR family response regulator/two-component system response regulator QseB